MERFSALVLKLRLPSEVVAGKAHALFQCAGEIVQLVIREISLVGADIIQGLGPGGGVTLVQAFQQTSDLGAALRVRQAAHPIGITDCRAAAAGDGIALGVFAGDGLVLLGAHSAGVIGQVRVLGLPQRRHIVCRVLPVQTGVAAEIAVGRQGLCRVQVPGVAVVVLIQQRLCPLVCAVSGQGRPAGPYRSFSVGKWAQKCPLMRRNLHQGA